VSRALRLITGGGSFDKGSFLPRLDIAYPPADVVLNGTNSRSSQSTRDCPLLLALKSNLPCHAAPSRPVVAP
jgi:hypothetical protein